MWLIGVTFLSLLPGEHFGENKVDGLDKVIHIFFYLFLSLLLSVPNIRQVCIQHKYTFRPLWVAFLFSVFWGILMEMIQGTVFVSRQIETTDILANILGASIGIACFYIIYGHPKNYTPWKTKSQNKQTLEKNQVISSLWD